MTPVTCCPGKPHYSKGLCEKCYDRAAHRRRMLSLEQRAASSRRSKAWALANPEKVFKSKKNTKLLKKYGITLDEYNRISATQQHKCAICNKPETLVTTNRATALAIDHCHATGRIRGLLCFRCNTSISIVENDPSLLLTIQAYLKGRVDE